MLFSFYTQDRENDKSTGKTHVLRSAPHSAILALCHYLRADWRWGALCRAANLIGTSRLSAGIYRLHVTPNNGFFNLRVHLNEFDSRTDG